MAQRDFEIAREEEELAHIKENAILREVKASDLVPGPILQPPFAEREREIFRRFAKTFAEVYPRTPEQWEEGFRRDIHPFTEIRIWQTIEAAYLHFTEGRSLDLEQKEHISAVILAVVNNPEATLLKDHPRTLSRTRVREIIDYTQQEWGRRKTSAGD
jgi:hypothetical protein